MSTRFKQGFLFEHLVDLSKPVCQAIDPFKANMTIFDSSGIETWVKENNPKYAYRIIKQLKSHAKSMGFNDSYNSYKAAYSSMPSHFVPNLLINQLFIDGHFCYAYKFSLVTNGLGIIQHITVYNKDFFNQHPYILIGKKTDFPDEDRSVHDTKLLIPTL